MARHGQAFAKALTRNVFQDWKKLRLMLRLADSRDIPDLLPDSKITYRKDRFYCGMYAQHKICLDILESEDHAKHRDLVTAGRSPCTLKYGWQCLEDYKPSGRCFCT